MKKNTNPYLVKAHKLSIFYWLTFLISLLLSMLLIMLAGDKENWFSTIAPYSTMPPSFCVIFLFPYIGYILYLRKLAKIHKEEHSTVYAENITDPADPRPLQEIQYFGNSAENNGSWGPIIALLCLVMPLGLYLALKKAYTDYRYYLENALVLSTIWKTFILAGVLICSINVFLFRDADLYFIILISFLPFICGIMLFITEKRIHKYGYNIAKCQNLILVHSVLSIPELSARLGKTYSQTVKMIQNYIDEGFLLSCFIDYKQKMVVAPVQYPKMAVKCKSCGGTTVKLKGISSVCSYCGKTLT